MAEKEARAHRASEVAARMETEYLQAQAGKVLPVLFEEEKEGLWRGHTPNYLEVRVQGESLHNALKQVEIQSAEGNLLRGKLVDA